MAQDIMSIPIILTIISGVSLLLFIKGPNAVWGGATFGAIIGIIVGLVLGNFSNGLMWGFSVGTLLGVGAELLGKLSDRLRAN